MTLTGGGPCTLTASQPGDANYQPAPEVSQSFNVLFDFTGFLRPVLDPATVNRVKAGQTVPIRFLLGGRPRGDVVAGGSPTVQRIDCKTLEPVGEPEPASSVSRGGVHRRPESTLYTYLWRTERRWAGTCRQLNLELVDGSEHRASFAFGREHDAHRR